jgi:hypothetical protein
VSDAAVRFTWKNSTSTPCGGSSVIESDTGTVFPDGGAGMECVVDEEQPDNSVDAMAARNRNKRALRIGASNCNVRKRFAA